MTAKWWLIGAGAASLIVGIALAVPVLADFIDCKSSGFCWWIWLPSEEIKVGLGAVLIVAGLIIGIVGIRKKKLASST